MWCWSAYTASGRGSDVILAQPVSPDVIRRTTEEVLAQADYQAVGGPSLVDRVMTYISEQLGRLLLRFGDGGGTGAIVASIALVGIVLLLVAAVVVFLRRLRPVTTAGSVVVGPVGRDPLSWAHEADEHETAGDLRQALRCRYRETLARLAAARLVEEIPGRTTGEYLIATTRALPTSSQDFAALTRVFEQTWYGDREVDVTTLQQVKDLQRNVVRAIPAGRSLTTV